MKRRPLNVPMPSPAVGTAPSVYRPGAGIKAADCGPGFRSRNTTRRRRRCGGLGRRALLLAGLATMGCLAPRGRPFELTPDVERPTRSVVVFFVDGLHHGRLWELLDAGRLPNIAERFVAGGVGVEFAIASLPSITYPNTVSLLTGRFPGHHGILGNRWFDRYSLEHRDYVRAKTYRTVNEHFLCPTLYELLDDRFTVNVQCHTRRGVTTTIDNWTATGMDWGLGQYINVDRRVGSCIKEVAALANRVRRWPTVLWTYYPGLDEIGHRYTAASDRYTEALINIDEQVGRISGEINALGMGQRTYYVLATDHGHVPTGDGKRLVISDWLRERCGLRVHEGPVDDETYAARFARLDPFDAVVVTSAFRRSAIHLRGPRGWSSPPLPEMVQRVLSPRASGLAVSDVVASDGAAASRDDLWQQPGIACVCVPDGADGVLVYSRSGWARIERRRRAALKEYRLMSEPHGDDQGDAPPDPFGYRSTPESRAVADGGWHDSRTWLAATATSTYPDFVPQVVEMFDSPRAGNIVVFAAEDWALSERDLSGHGSCLAADMRVPLYFAGPDLPRGATIRHARVVDLMPTILDLLNESDRLAAAGPIDGVSIAEELRHADSSATVTERR